ncbi:hypothetical protein H1V43_32310 [Streptomyces sp. PSKA54]|uniref:Uncharacterized protein n=1 Tax=Streptomyces himalayensis subsp. aureolus TaxID=2758039 RepID=A0A7W2HJC8_9ACTN|nr:hypothetical protein [Streptomyces himalayensis]MBA4865948.1 hypothetical protein [Streptomyces himalayensis subsp. aureolus]
MSTEQPIPREIRAIRIGFRPEAWQPQLNNIASAFSALDDLYLYADFLHKLDEVARDEPLTPEVIDSVFWQAEVHAYNVTRPEVRNLEMRSPLSLELFGLDSPVPPALAFLYWLLKNPERIAEFYPRLRESWHEGNMRAERAWHSRKELKSKLGSEPDVEVIDLPENEPSEGEGTDSSPPPG